MNSKARVLIVDDDRELRDFLYCVLKDRYLVAAIGGAVEALSYLAGNSVNVILIDYNMPKIDGITALGEIKKSCPDTEVIMMTGNASPDIREKAFNLGAFAFLKKPLNIAELFKTIDEALQEKIPKKY
jgi:DNA-binding NtrC family response regulator